MAKVRLGPYLAQKEEIRYGYFFSLKMLKLATAGVLLHGKR